MGQEQTIRNHRPAVGSQQLGIRPLSHGGRPPPTAPSRRPASSPPTPGPQTTCGWQCGTSGSSCWAPAAGSLLSGGATAGPSSTTCWGSRAPPTPASGVLSVFEFNFCNLSEAKRLHIYGKRCPWWTCVVYNVGVNAFGCVHVHGCRFVSFHTTRRMCLCRNPLQADSSYRIDAAATLACPLRMVVAAENFSQSGLR